MPRFLRSAFLKRYLRRNAIMRGLLGGQNIWRAVFVAGQLAKFAGKVTKRGAAPVVFSESLDPRAGFAVVNLPHEPKRAKKRKRRRSSS